MSRSGYTDDFENNWTLIIWRGAVASAIRGRRGQALLTDLLVALDAMPDKRLIQHELIQDGEVCTLGALGKSRGLAQLAELDPDEPEDIARAFGVAPALVREIEFENDEGGCQWPQETPEQRWTRMRAWVTQQIISQEVP